MANDLIEMEKSSVNRIVGLESAVSKCHEQFLENNNSTRNIQPKLQISEIPWMQLNKCVLKILLF